MEHEYYHNENFNILTIKTEKDKWLISGESKEPIAIGDFINYKVGKTDVLGVNKVTERRDSRDFPKGNKLFYRVECTPCPPPTKEPVVG